MSISHFSLYEGSSSQPSDFLSKVLKPRFWQKRKTSAPPPALDFATPKKGLGRWFGISASESKQPARQISEPRYIEDPHDEYAREFAEPAHPRCRSAMELCNPSTFLYSSTALTPSPFPTYPTSFPTTPRSSDSRYDQSTLSRKTSSSFSSIPSMVRPSSIYYTPSDSSLSSTSSSHPPSSAYFKRHSPRSSASSQSSFATSIGSSVSSPLNNLRRSSANPLLFADAENDPDVAHEVQSAFDSATRNLSKALDLPLVYLVALDLSVLTALPTLTLLSSVGLASTSPCLSPSLHFQALRAPEGGLLYRAPEGTTPMFTAGILIPVMEVRRVGYVLCAYTDDPERELEARDVKYVTRFAEELECWVTRMGRVEV